MGREDRVRLIAELLHQTDSAHHSYLNKVLGKDEDAYWPEWYAEYLIGHGLDLLMDDRLATELRVGFLSRCREEYRTCNPGLSWEEYTARKFVEKLV